MCLQSTTVRNKRSFTFPSVHSIWPCFSVHPIVRTLKRGILLSSLILLENLFASFCWINSFVLNVHIGKLLPYNEGNLKLILLCSFTGMPVKKLFDNTASFKLLWWDQEEGGSWSRPMPEKTLRGRRGKLRLVRKWAAAKISQRNPHKEKIE